MSPVLARNIRSLKERRAQEERSAGAEERVAEVITRFARSMMFVFLHLAVFGVWVLVDVGLLPILPK